MYLATVIVKSYSTDHVAVGPELVRYKTLCPSTLQSSQITILHCIFSLHYETFHLYASLLLCTFVEVFFYNDEYFAIARDKL